MIRSGADGGKKVKSGVVGIGVNVLSEKSGVDWTGDWGTVGWIGQGETIDYICDNVKLD